MTHNSTVTPEPRLNIVEQTVSELSMALKRTIEDGYGYVRVRGELGNVKYHSSGHIYLDLKDDRACLAGVIWRGTAPRIKLKLEAGLEVVVTGRVTTYPGQSKYQIVIESLEPAGLGALMALVEERKKKLAAEGLFDPSRKQLLPFLPTVIGVVTSPTGAVIRDILHRLADRFPRHVIVWPVKVQGDASAAEVAAAIRGFNALLARGPTAKPDVLIVARGGGSLEDLWSFNEEIVVRAAAESMIPLISAVGHETDVTLIDFAADVRAPTPTAAAEMAVPVRTDLLLRLDSMVRRSFTSWRRSQEARRTELRAAMRALPSAEDLLALPRQRLDHAAARLPRALIAHVKLHENDYSKIASRLTKQTLRTRIASERTQLAVLTQRASHCLRVHVERRRERFNSIALRMNTALASYANAQKAGIARARESLLAMQKRSHVAVHAILQNRDIRLERAERLLAAVSYRAVLERGFALVRDLDNKPLRTAAAVAGGLPINIEFSDGRVRARTEGGVTPTAPTPSGRRRRGSGGGDDGQGSLFGA